MVNYAKKLKNHLLQITKGWEREGGIEIQISILLGYSSNCKSFSGNLL